MTDPNDAGMGAVRPFEPGEMLGAALIHELRHPLLGIKAGLELFALGNAAVMAGSYDLRMVQMQVRRLEELLRTYQELFSAHPAACARLALASVVRRGVELLEYRLARLGPRFSCSELPELEVWGVPDAVLHAVINLLSNGIEALEQKSGGGRLAVRALPWPAGAAEIRVSDEGSGIAPEDRVRLFTPWFTTKGCGRGTGLGLHIARVMMLRAGGDVKLVADDDPERMPWAATEFAVVLPPVPEGA